MMAEGRGTTAKSGSDRARAGTFLLLFLIAVTVRVVYLLDYAETIPTYSRPLVDAKIYDAWAARIAAGDFWGRGEGVFYRAPLYPYLLAGLRSVFGSLQPATALVQAGLGLAAVFLTARLSAKWAGPVAGLATFALLTFYGPLYTAEPKLLGTVLGLFLQVAVLTVAVNSAERPRARTALGLGLLLGAAVLVRPLWLLWVAVLPLVLVGGRGWRDRVRPWLAFPIGVALVVGPVAIRNHVVGDDLVLIASNGGMTFFQGNNVENRSGLLTVISRFEMFGSAERQQEIEVRVASELSGRDLRPSEASRFWFRQGLDFIVGSPGAWLVLEGRKLLRFVSSFEPGDNYSHALERDRLPVLRILFLPFGLLLALGLLGLGRSGPFPPTARVAIVGAATGALGCLLFFVSSRYRMEAVPGLAILAGGAIAQMAGRFASRPGSAPSLSGFRPTRAQVLLFIAALLVLSVTWLPAGAPAKSQESISLLQIGNAYERRGDRDAARRAYRESIDRLPTNAFAWRSLLQLTVQDSGATVALARLDSAPESAREHPEVRHLRGRFLAALGRSEEAVEELSEVARERPEMREAWFYLGSALRDTRRYSDAERAFERAIATGWPEADVWSTLSFLRIQTGDLDGARSAAERALAIDPEQAEARLNLIVADVYLGHLDEARELLRSRPAEDPMTRYYAGLIDLREGRWEEAARALGLAAGAQPDNRRASYYRALALAALGRTAEPWSEDTAGWNLALRWFQVRSEDPWSGVPRRGAAKPVWDELAAADSAFLREIVRYVGEEEAGLRPPGNP